MCNNDIHVTVISDVPVGTTIRGAFFKPQKTLKMNTTNHDFGRQEEWGPDINYWAW